MVQEKLPSASVNPVINQGFKLVLTRVVDISEVLVIIVLLLTLEKVEYLRWDKLLQSTNLRCMDRYLSQ